MASLLRMPEVAAGASTVVLAEWPLAEESSFDVDDPIAVIETDKAVVEIEAEHPGVLLKTLVIAGAEVEVGAPIAVIAERGEQIDDLPALLARLGVGGVSVGGAGATPDAADVAAAPDLVAEASPVVDPATPARTAEPDSSSSAASRGRIFASPLARRLARDAGIDLADLTGTGPNGRVVRRDIEADQARARTVSSQETARPVTEDAAYTDEPHTKLRRAVAARLTESKQSQPHFYLSGSARVDALLEARAQLNAVSSSKISVNDLLIKAMAKAHQLVPEMNCIWTPDTIRRFSGVDIAVAIASDRGLLTPVLRGVDSMSITDIAITTKDFVERAGKGKVKQRELEGGCTTISNLGMFGVDEFSAIINPPQSSILAVGAAQQQPIVVDGVVEIGSVLRVVLSVDHRPVDGAVAARWMRAFVTALENPIQIFA